METDNNSTDKNNTPPNSGDSYDRITKRRLRSRIGSSRASQQAWRKELIMRYTSLGYSQVRISEMIGCSQACVSQNLAALTKAALANVSKQVEEVIPMELEKTKTLYEEIKSRAIDIANNTTHDRDRISALALAKDCGESIYELTTERKNVKRAIKAAAGIRQKMEELEDRRQEEEEQEEEEVRFYKPIPPPADHMNKKNE